MVLSAATVRFVYGSGTCGDMRQLVCRYGGQARPERIFGLGPLLDPGAAFCTDTVLFWIEASILSASVWGAFYKPSPADVLTEATMKETPWQDIFSLAEWEHLVDSYRRRAISGSPTGPFDRLGSTLGIKRTIPTQLTDITRQIQVYSAIEKASADTIGRRIQQLNVIATLGQSYLNRYSLPLKPEKRDSIDNAVAKLVRRAVRKADYLTKLRQHVEAGDRGFGTDRESLLDYLSSKKDRRCVGLVGVNSSDMMERVDPWHRGFDLKPSKNSTVRFLPGGGSVLGFAFFQWQRSKSDIPFFVWLEGHGVCTGCYDKDSQGFLDSHHESDRVRQVLYHDSAGPLAPEILLIGPHNAQLWAYRTEKDGNLSLDFYDTSATRNQLRNTGMDAYVWSKDGLIFAAPHLPGELHHSSFTSGKKVRCAGFIGVKEGKVIKVDNDSGHYKPPPHLLREFVRYLHEQNVVHPDASFDLVGTGGAKNLTWVQLQAWKPALPGPKPTNPLKPPVPQHRPWRAV